MSNATFVDDWNSVLPFKIKATDLEKPTEQFVYKAVLSVLKLMQYDVSSYENIYNESTELLTVKRVELVARINYFYQLCSDSKQNSFFYADFVKPTTKKIVHVLKILLNYLFYINMVKQTVLEKANNCTEKYFELNANLNQKEIANEENKIKANNINRHIDGLKNQLPHLKHQIEILQQRKQMCQEKLSTLKGNEQDLADKIIKLKLQHSELEDQLVVDEESTDLKNTLNSLKEEIESLVESEKTLREKTYDIYAASINGIRPCIAQLEKILHFEFDNCYEADRVKIVELNELYEATNKQCADLLATSASLNHKCADLSALVEEKQREIAVRKTIMGKRGAKTEGKLNEQDEHLKELEKMNELYDILLELKQYEVQKVIDTVEESFNTINNSSIPYAANTKTS